MNINQNELYQKSNNNYPFEWLWCLQILLN